MYYIPNQDYNSKKGKNLHHKMKYTLIHSTNLLSKQARVCADETSGDASLAVWQTHQINICTSSKFPIGKRGLVPVDTLTSTFSCKHGLVLTNLTVMRVWPFGKLIKLIYVYHRKKLLSDPRRTKSQLTNLCGPCAVH
jgi:hypothetical protein